MPRPKSKDRGILYKRLIRVYKALGLSFTESRRKALKLLSENTTKGKKGK